ncbi:MAG: serine/threonine protein kinase [Myxococcales bacterium]|nr:serine/threonine protein kinase [Myxococcales bacterium]
MFDERSAKSRIGEAIGGKFRLEKLIGVGAMGAVYQALHEWTQRRVAVKLLFDEGDRASSKEAIERFFREARAATKIGHRNIVEVLDMGQHSDGTYYLVQELLEGETLRQRLDRLGRLSLTEAFELLLPVMDALSAAHAAGVVHRDVKPENILLHAERKTSRAAKLVPKLIDFGVAKTSAQSVKLTAAGVVLGTPNYMAPEQVDGAVDIDARADIWSVGVLLYECLSGRRPFAGASVRDVFAAITTTQPPPLSSLVATLPEGVVSVVHSALNRDRTLRFSSMNAMITALSAIVELTSSPHLQDMFASFAMPAMPRSTTDAKPALAEASAAQPARPGDSTHRDARSERDATSSNQSARRSTGSRRRQPSSPTLAVLGVALTVTTVAFGAFTIRGSRPPSDAQRASSDAGVAITTEPRPVSNAPALVIDSGAPIALVAARDAATAAIATPRSTTVRPTAQRRQTRATQPETSAPAVTTVTTPTTHARIE